MKISNTQRLKSLSQHINEALNEAKFEWPEKITVLKDAYLNGYNSNKNATIANDYRWETKKGGISQHQSMMVKGNVYTLDKSSIDKDYAEYSRIGGLLSPDDIQQLQKIGVISINESLNESKTIDYVKLRDDINEIIMLRSAKVSTAVIKQFGPILTKHKDIKGAIDFAKTFIKNEKTLEQVLSILNSVNESQEEFIFDFTEEEFNSELEEFCESMENDDTIDEGIKKSIGKFKGRAKSAYQRAKEKGKRVSGKAKSFIKSLWDDDSHV